MRTPPTQFHVMERVRLSGSLIEVTKELPHDPVPYTFVVVGPDDEREVLGPVKGGVRGDQCGGAKGSHFGPEKSLGDCGGEGLWSVAEEAFAPARRVWWGGARSSGFVCGGFV